MQDLNASTILKQKFTKTYYILDAAIMFLKFYWQQFFKMQIF